MPPLDQYNIPARKKLENETLVSGVGCPRVGLTLVYRTPLSQTIVCEIGILLRGSDIGFSWWWMLEANVAFQEQYGSMALIYWVIFYFILLNCSCVFFFIILLIKFWHLFIFDGGWFAENFNVRTLLFIKFFLFILFLEIFLL